MIESLAPEQKLWVRKNSSKYSWRRLAEEFEKVWSGSFEPIMHKAGDQIINSFSQADGIWLCDEAGVVEEES
jgi:hypothetical protein